MRRLLVPLIALLATAAAPAPVALGGQAELGWGITVTPLAVEEDSRCPAGTSCIWAGRLVLRAAIEKGAQTQEKLLVLGTPDHVYGGMLTLTSAEPAAADENRPEDYRFSFSFAPDIAR